jgi:predicted aspartyl protease
VTSAVHGYLAARQGHMARQARRLVFILLALLNCIPVHAAERLVVPFDVNSYGQMVVQLHINDTAQATGVVDTAATHAMIDLTTANSAGVPMPGDAMINVLGLEGAEIFPLVRVDSLAAGNVRMGQVNAALNRRIDVMGVHNIVPANAFAGDVIDFDFDAGRILVYDGRPDTSTTLTPSRLPMRLVNGLWFAEVKLNGKMGLALIDTGSSISYVNSRFADDAGAKPNEEKTRELLGITGEGVPIRVATARRFSLGRHRVLGPDLLVADPAIFAHLGLADEPVMVLGLDYLSIFRVQLDRRERRLVLSSQSAKRGMSGIRLNSGGSRLRTN